MAVYGMNGESFFTAVIDACTCVCTINVHTCTLYKVT